MNIHAPSITMSPAYSNALAINTTEAEVADQELKQLFSSISNKASNRQYFITRAENQMLEDVINSLDPEASKTFKLDEGKIIKVKKEPTIQIEFKQPIQVHDRPWERMTPRQLSDFHRGIETRIGGEAILSDSIAKPEVPTTKIQTFAVLERRDDGKFAFKI